MVLFKVSNLQLIQSLHLLKTFLRFLYGLI
nr:MAG TPA: hypothetical protein [Caudoviricetes sp.]